MNKRDDFSQKTIDTLCERVGGKCSNPNCRRETKGPHSNPQKRVSIGQLVQRPQFAIVLSRQIIGRGDFFHLQL
mgnify:CR=1 FL=1